MIDQGAAGAKRRLAGRARLARWHTRPSPIRQDTAIFPLLRTLAAGLLAVTAVLTHAGQEAPSRLASPGTHAVAVSHDGIDRKYLVHVPAGYDAAVPTPLLVSLHGGGAHMEYQANDENYGQVAKADRERYIVVFPNGYSKLPGGRFATWNAGTCCAAARNDNADDVGFIRRVVADVSRQLNVDRSRVWATGMSNGGQMAYRLACDAADVFTAIAPVAGTDNTRGCEPKRPVSVIHFHAANDDHSVFEGGRGARSFSRATVTDFTSVPDTIARWVRLNGCPATPQRVLDRPGAWCDLHAPCRGGTRVQLCVTERGAHSWPGARRSRSSEPASQAISANDLMWDFLNGR